MNNRKVLDLIFLNRKVIIKCEEYTYDFSGKHRDCYAGDTGIIEYVDSSMGYMFDDLSFVIKLDDYLFSDGRYRESSLATSDYSNLIFL